MGDSSLCGWKSEDIEKNLKKLAGIVSQPKVVCRRCARAASKRKYVCKPVALPRGKKKS